MLQVNKVLAGPHQSIGCSSSHLMIARTWLSSRMRQRFKDDASNKKSYMAWQDWVRLDFISLRIQILGTQSHDHNIDRICQALYKSKPSPSTLHLMDYHRNISINKKINQLFSLSTASHNEIYNKVSRDKCQPGGLVQNLLGTLKIVS